MVVLLVSSYTVALAVHRPALATRGSALLIAVTISSARVFWR